MGNSYVQSVVENVRAKNPHQPEFLQAVEEVLFSMQPLFDRESKYQENAILERIVVPERLVEFRVGLDRRQGPHSGEQTATACSSTPPSDRTRAVCASIPA